MSLKIVKDAAGIIFAPTKEQVGDPTGCMYPRVIELKQSNEKALLATFENYSKEEPPFAPIYKSIDGGISWELFSKIEDTKNGYGMRFQPVLMELDQDIADLKKGTLLFAGNSIPSNMTSTELLFFVSKDHGKTWEFRSSVAKGGAPVEQNFESLGPIWEPFIYLNKKGEIVIMFSDERLHNQENYNQVLVLVKSSDGGKTWGKEKLVVALKDKKLRPGMPIVTSIANGKYFLCYEIVGTLCNDIYYKISEDGENFGDPADFGTRAETEDGFYLGSMPYCTYAQKGGENGTIILQAKRDSGEIGLNLGSFLVNYNNGEGKWERIPLLIEYDNRILQTGWSKGMAVFDNGNKLIMLSPVQTNSTLMHIAYAIAKLEEE